MQRQGLSIQIGGERRRLGRFWVPDGLHIWWRSHGVHLWAFGPVHVLRENDPDWRLP